MEEDICSCIIHTCEISNNVSPVKDFTAVTLSKLLNSRKIWLSLNGNLTDVAVKSLEYFSDHDEQAFINEGTVPDRSLQYHIECYRKFTDKTRIIRAQRMSETSDTPCTSKDIEPAAKKTRAEETRQTRSRLQPHGSTATGSRSTPVLPRICLICKKADLTYTCPVSQKLKLFCQKYETIIFYHTTINIYPVACKYCYVL